MGLIFNVNISWTVSYEGSRILENVAQVKNNHCVLQKLKIFIVWWVNKFIEIPVNKNQQILRGGGGI